MWHLFWLRMMKYAGGLENLVLNPALDVWITGDFGHFNEQK